MVIRNAIKHFLDFHKGTVNIVLHILGFAGIFYSIYKLDWLLFAGSFIIVEIGHVDNHFTGIKKYDFRPRVIFWRLIIILTLLLAFYFVTKQLF